MRCYRGQGSLQSLLLVAVSCLSIISGRPAVFEEGLAAEQRGDIAAAAKHFAAALAEQPRPPPPSCISLCVCCWVFILCAFTLSRWPWSGLYLANAELNLGRVHDAVKHFYAFLEAEPSVVEARVNLGAALQNLGKLDAAIQQYTLGLKVTHRCEPVLGTGPATMRVVAHPVARGR